MKMRKTEGLPSYATSLPNALLNLYIHEEPLKNNDSYLIDRKKPISFLPEKYVEYKVTV